MTKTKSPRITPKALALILQDMGYRGKLAGTVDRPTIESASGGLTFYVHFMGSVVADGVAPEWTSVMFDVGMYLRKASDVAGVAQLCGRFNSNYRWVKAFVSGEPNPFACMQFDVDLVHGVEGWIAEHTALFITSIDRFAEEVLNTPAFRGDDAAELHGEAVRLLRGPDSDPDRAVDLYREASRRGFAGSQNNLGDLYEWGGPVARSEIFAAFWYARAAERGEPTAYLSLATLLSKEPVDRAMLIEAAKFAILASDQLPAGRNGSAAKDCLRLLETELSVDEMVEAREAARVWKPLYQERRLIADAPDNSLEPAKSLH